MGETEGPAGAVTIGGNRRPTPGEIGLRPAEMGYAFHRVPRQPQVKMISWCILRLGLNAYRENKYGLVLTLKCTFDIKMYI